MSFILLLTKTAYSVRQLKNKRYSQVSYNSANIMMLERWIGGKDGQHNHVTKMRDLNCVNALMPTDVTSKNTGHTNMSVH